MNKWLLKWKMSTLVSSKKSKLASKLTLPSGNLTLRRSHLIRMRIVTRSWKSKSVSTRPNSRSNALRLLKHRLLPRKHQSRQQWPKLVKWLPLQKLRVLSIKRRERLKKHNADNKKNIKDVSRYLQRRQLLKRPHQRRIKPLQRKNNADSKNWKLKEPTKSKTFYFSSDQVRKNWKKKLSAFKMKKKSRMKLLRRSLKTSSKKWTIRSWRQRKSWRLSACAVKKKRFNTSRELHYSRLNELISMKRNLR